MLKKIILTLFISYGLFQLFDVNYRMGHEGVGLLDIVKSKATTTEIQPISVTSSSVTSPIAPVINPCDKAGFVLNPAFTNNIKARLPEVLLEGVSPKRNTLFYFSELIGVKSPVVEFRWRNDGKELHRELVEVKGLRWRAWSSIINLAGAELHVNTTVPLVVEVWSDQCLLYTSQIVFAEDEKSTPLELAKSYFDYHSTSLGDASDAYQYSREVNETALVYRFDEERLKPKIYIDIESQQRNESTRDVFTQYVERDEALPLPHDLGGKVTNYSDVNINRKTTAGDTVLLEAIKHNSRNTIKSLLAIGANPFIRDAENQSPLDLALAAKDRELTDLLVEHMLWGHAVGRKDWSHTNFAEILSAGNYQFLKRRNRLGETSLMRAAASGDEFAIIGLVGMNSTSTHLGELPYQDPYHFDYAGRQAVDIAQEAGYKGATLLLEKTMEQFAPAWANYRMLIASEGEGDNPTKCFVQPGKRIWLLATLVDMPIKKVKLVWSVSKNYSDSGLAVKTQEFFTSNTEFQLKGHIDPAELKGYSGYLHADLYFNNRRIRGASITKSITADSEVMCDYYDNHPKNSLKLQFAAWVPAQVVAKRAQGFSADSIRIHQKLLDDAIAYESPSLLKYLFDQGMPANIKYNHKAFLRSAVFENKLALTQHLLAEGESLEAVDASVRLGKRSLMEFAVAHHDLIMVHFLVEQGLSVNETDANLAQPLEVAINNCDADMVALLLQLGANPFATISARENKTVWEFAEQCVYEPRVMEALNSTRTLTHAR